MGWAANPARKQESMFSLAVMQMGARVYIPTLGRFIQVDPIDGGVLNAYTYVADPINLNDYTGLCTYIIQCTATIEYFQPAAPVSHVQPTAGDSSIQKANTRLQTAAVRTAQQVSPPPKLQRIDVSKIPNTSSIPKPPVQGYANVSVGASYIVAFNIGIAIGLDGSIHPQVSFGLGLKPGLDWSYTLSPSEVSSGVSLNASGFLWAGGGLSSDGSYEWGFGQPGVSVMASYTW